MQTSWYQTTIIVIVPDQFMFKSIIASVLLYKRMVHGCSFTTFNFSWCYLQIGGAFLRISIKMQL